ncbi:MAG: uroporphyrinogen-III synthase [Candidatus Bathyarchaeales archaeon]
MVQKTPTLKGKTIAITRAQHQAQETAMLIEQMGGKPYLIPTLEFKMSSDLSQVKEFIKELQEGKIDYTVFMSVNALKYLFEAAESLGLKSMLSKGLEKTTIVAVGPRTAKELKNRQIPVKILPEEYSSEGVAQTLQKLGVLGKTIFIPRASGASPVLKRKLEEIGGKVREIYIYEQQTPKNANRVNKFIEDLAAGKIDAIIFGSSQSVRNMFQIFMEKISPEKLMEMLKRLTIVTIGPATAKTLNEMGLEVDVTPKLYTFQEALKALASYWNA